MSELVLPTLDDVDRRELEYRKYVIDKNVYDIVLSMYKSTKFKNGAFRGSTMLIGTSSTLSTYENIRDCIVSKLENLENSQYWHFKVNDTGELFWSSLTFPPDKPWWRFW